MTKSALFDRLFSVDEAQAHCDIPCGIYDPSTAQIAALSVIRMMDIIAENAEKDASAATANSMSRCIALKEVEAEKVKHEIRIIWGDYIKAPHIEKHPGVHDLAHQIMMAGGKCKQGVDRADGEKLLDLVNQFAEIFWETKGKATERKTAPYAPAMEVVMPVL